MKTRTETHSSIKNNAPWPTTHRNQNHNQRTYNSFNSTNTIPQMQLINNTTNVSKLT